MLGLIPLLTANAADYAYCMVHAYWSKWGLRSLQNERTIIALSKCENSKKPNYSLSAKIYLRKCKTVEIAKSISLQLDCMDTMSRSRST